MKLARTITASLVLCLALSVAVHAGGTVMVFGGLNVPADGLATLVKLSGGSSGTIAVGPWGSRSESVESLATALRSAGAGKVVVLSDDTTRLKGARASQMMQGVTAVVFSDADPHQVSRTLRGTAFLNVLRQAVETGGVIAAVGRSATALSETMLDLSPPNVVPAIRTKRFTSTGLGFLASTVIAPEVMTGGQLSHLTAVVGENAWLIGVGVENGTALAVREGVLTVFGQGTVVVVDPFPASVKKREDGALGMRGAFMHTLLAGEQYSLRKRAPIPRPY